MQWESQGKCGLQRDTLGVRMALSLEWSCEEETRNEVRGEREE